MSQSAKLRQLHLTILAAIKQAEEIEAPADFSVEASRELIRKKEELVYQLECAVFNELYTIKRIVDITYPPIEPADLDYQLHYC